MILRMSTLFLRTLRDDPADAEVPSHRLLVRAGYIRRAAPGIYTWLPLGLRVLRKIEAIIREEMDAIGAQEVRFPALLPREPYEATGRWTEYGDDIFRLKDRKGGDYLLGPDARGDVHPRGEGPVLVLQGPAAVDLPDPDQVPRRGAAARRPAARPRVRHEGLLLLRRRRRRARARRYQAHRDAYIRIFDRLGFDYVIVEATSGAMGGSRVGGVPRQRRGRRGHLRPLHALRLRRQRRGRRRCAPPAPVAVRRRAGRARRGHARHPDHRHPGRRTSTRRSPATTGPGRPATR